MLPSTPQPEGKPLAHWDSQATDTPPNAQAKFMDGWVKLKPIVSIGLLWLFSVNASCEEWKTDVVALLRRQNSKPPSRLQPVGLVNPVLFLLTLAADNASLFCWPFGKLQTGRLKSRLPSLGPQTMETKHDCKCRCPCEGPFSDETNWNTSCELSLHCSDLLPTIEPDTQHTHHHKLGTK